MTREGVNTGRKKIVVLTHLLQSQQLRYKGKQTVVGVGNGVSFNRSIPNSRSYGPRFASTIEYGP